MKSTFTVTGYNTVEHRGTCPWTGNTFIRRYWVPLTSHGYGYVCVDTTDDGRRPGTLGQQPHTGGATWMCRPENLLDMIKHEWRIEKRQAAKSN